MSEADYMDDCQHASRYDEESKPHATHEVVAACGRVAWIGSRASCWAYKRQHGGFVQECLDTTNGEGE